MAGRQDRRAGKIDQADPDGSRYVPFPARDYLVFRHRGHISGIPATWWAIMEDWLPRSGCRMADALNFDRYADDFGANTGLGGVEIWIPIEA
jgi:AraC family transcriptional regulator